MKESKQKYGLLIGILMGVIFLLMLALNLFTPKMSDDFAYANSFLTKEPLTNFLDIFPSLWVHALKMNGRLVAHFFAQLFLMLPDWIFDLVNAFVFCGQLWLMYRIATQKGRHNPMLLLGLFGAIWVFMPAFGQVNLWLDGACNYLWCTAFGLLFLWPYIRAFWSGKPLKNPFSKLGFLVLSLLAGGFVENGSAAFFGMSVLLLIADAIQRKKAPKPILIWGSVLALIGYLSMYLAPAEWANKQTDFTASTLGENLIRAGEMYLRFLPLLIAFGVLFIIGLCRKTEGKRVWLSLIFLAGSLAANFILTFAEYYPERCASSALLLLLEANALLLYPWNKKAWKWIANLTLCVVLILSLLCMGVGIPDIFRVDGEISRNAHHIKTQKLLGETEIVIPVVKAQTRFCGLYDLKYIGTDTYDTWPNVSMATYYGVDRIRGE